MMFIYLFLIVLTCIIDVIVIISNAPEKYDMLWLLPFQFMLFSILFNDVIKVLGKSIVATILFSMLFFRNVFIPFLMALGNGKYLSNVDTSDYLFYSYLLYTYESFVVFFVIHKSCKKNFLYKENYALAINKKKVNNMFVFMLIILLLFALVVYLYPEMLLFYDFGFSTSDDERIYRNTLSASIQESAPRIYFYSYKTLFDWLRWLIPLAIIFKMYTMHIWKSVSIVISLLFILLSAVLGTDYRAASIFIMLSLFVLLTTLYPTYKKKLYLLCGAVFFFLGVVGLVVKSFGHSGTEDAQVQDMANLLQSYFSGPENVAIGLMMSGYPSLEVLVGDICKWIPYVNYFFKEYDSSMIQFNYTFFHETDVTTQILPMISQGERYFSFLGAPIFTYIVCKMAFWQEYKSLQAKTVMSYTINVMLFVSLPFTVFMYCFSQLFNIYIGTFLPTILVLCFYNKRKNEGIQLKSP